MRTVSLFLHLSLLFYIFLPCGLRGEEYRHIDLERLLSNHPMMRRFPAPDDSSGFTRIREELGQLEKRLAKAEADKALFLKSVLMNRPGAHEGEAVWERIREFDAGIALLRKNQEELSTLLAAGGIPPLEAMASGVKSISQDILSRHAHGLPTIILNSFPRFPVECPAFPEENLHTFLQTKDPAVLRRYASFSCYTSLLFGSTSNPVLFIKGENER